MRLIVSLCLWLAMVATVAAQTPNQFIVPLGYCQLSSSQLSSAIAITSCVSASFTGTASGTALTTTSVTGAILKGQVVAGVGVPNGTTIVSQTSGAAGGAGVYVTSVVTTASSASLTSGGIPPSARMAYLLAETANVRWRDDGALPTTSVGFILQTSVPPFLYQGTLPNLKFIALTGSPLLNILFYR